MRAPTHAVVPAPLGGIRLLVDCASIRCPGPTGSHRLNDQSIDFDSFRSVIPWELRRDHSQTVRPALARPTPRLLDSIIAGRVGGLPRPPAGQPRCIERARPLLAGGATSNWQIAEPQAVWLSHGAGSQIFDVDGNEYADFHGGYGVSLAGHAHPAIVGPSIPAGAAGHPLRPAGDGRRRRGGEPRRSASASRCGGSPTPAPKPRWTPCT